MFAIVSAALLGVLVFDLLPGWRTLGPGRIWPRIAVAAASFAAHPAAG
jgi:hypothetical protein